MSAQHDAVKAEATGSEIRFEFEGETYKVAAATEWDIEALEAAEDGRVATACRLLLGPAQWRTFRAGHKTVGDLGRLFEAIQAAIGVEGN